VPTFQWNMLLNYSTLKMEAAGSVEISATSYQTTVCHIPEDCNLNAHHWENSKFHKFVGEAIGGVAPEQISQHTITQWDNQEWWTIKKVVTPASVHHLEITADALYVVLLSLPLYYFPDKHVGTPFPSHWWICHNRRTETLH